MLIHIDRRVISETRICGVGSQISGSRYFSRINGRISLPRTNFRSEIDLFVDRSSAGTTKKKEKKKKTKTKKTYLRVFFFFFFNANIYIREIIFRSKQQAIRDNNFHNNFHS